MNALYWISAAAFCVLLTRPLPASFLLAPAVVLTLAFCLREKFAGGKGIKPDENGRVQFSFAGILLSAGLAALFAVVWLRTRRLVSLHSFDIRAASPILAAAASGFLLSLPFSMRLMALLRTPAGEFCGKTLTGETGLSSKSHKWILLIMAAAAITLCSASSPLYPLNDWVDANCFFTVGKSMLFGKIPYRDLYEQKGPLLYVLYAMAYPVSHTSFLGVWIFEIAAAWLFLLRADEVIRTICGARSIPAILLTTAFVYTCPAFLRGGSAEEFCLPLLMLPLCVGTEMLLNGRELRTAEALRIGLGAGAVLWIKYSMLGLYPAWFVFLAVVMIRRGQGRQLLRAFLAIVAGALLSTAPILLYFVINDALSDLWTAYIVNNIFTYGKSSSAVSMVRALLSGAASMLTYNDGTVLAVILAFVVFLREGKRKLAWWMLLCFGSAFAIVYMGGINMKYYSEILCVFFPFGAAALWKLVYPADAKACSIRNRTGHILVCAALFILMLLGSENREMLLKPKREMPQYLFAEKIEERPGASLFNYGALDIGQYTVSDIVPTCRYFCMLNLQSEEMFHEMDRYMEEGVTDFIVSRDLPVMSPYYKLVMQTEYPSGGISYTYYLYERTEAERTE